MADSYRYFELDMGFKLPMAVNLDRSNQNLSQSMGHYF